VLNLGILGSVERRSAVPEQVDAEPVGEGIIGAAVGRRAGGTDDQKYRDGYLEIDGYLLSYIESVIIGLAILVLYVTSNRRSTKKARRLSRLAQPPLVSSKTFSQLKEKRPP